MYIEITVGEGGAFGPFLVNILGPHPLVLTRRAPPACPLGETAASRGPNYQQ